MSQSPSAAPLVLSGREAGREQLKIIQSEIMARTQAPRPPCLVVIQVGDNPASASYIRQKEKTATEFGVRFIHSHLSGKSTEADVAKVIAGHAADSGVDGMILQLPMDSALLGRPDVTDRLLELIPPSKDADGLHPVNLGRLFSAESTAKRWTSPLPATALGVFRLLDHFKIGVDRKNIAVVGKSRLVGMPTAGLLLHEGATVTVCHSHTQDLGAHLSRAEIVVVAAGRKHLVQPEHLRPNAVVVDVGIHATADRKITGDLDPRAYPLCAAYSPVPGGVGPMTVAMLIENVLRLYERAFASAK